MSEQTADPRLYPDRPFLAASVAVFRDGKVLLASRTAAPAADNTSVAIFKLLWEIQTVQQSAAPKAGSGRIPPLRDRYRHG